MKHNFRPMHYSRPTPAYVIDFPKKKNKKKQNNIEPCKILNCIPSTF